MKLCQKLPSSRNTNWKYSKHYLPSSASDILLRGSSTHSYGFMDTCRICAKDILRKGQSRPRICLDCEKKKAKPIHDKCKDCLEAIIRSNVRKARLCPKCKKQREKLRHEATCTAFTSFSTNPLFSRATQKNQINSSLMWLRFYTAYTFFYSGTEESWKNSMKMSRYHDKSSRTSGQGQKLFFPDRTCFIKIPVQQYNTPEDIVVFFANIMTDDRVRAASIGLVRSRGDGPSSQASSSILIPQVNMYLLDMIDINSKSEKPLTNLSVQEIVPSTVEMSTNYDFKSSKKERNFPGMTDQAVTDSTTHHTNCRIGSSNPSAGACDDGSKSEESLSAFSNLLSLRKRIKCPKPLESGTQENCTTKGKNCKLSLSTSIFLVSSPKIKDEGDKYSEILLEHSNEETSKEKFVNKLTSALKSIIHLDNKSLSQPEPCKKDNAQKCYLGCRRSESLSSVKLDRDFFYIPRLIPCSVPGIGNPDPIPNYDIKKKNSSPDFSKIGSDASQQLKEYAMLEKTLKSIGDRSRKLKKRITLPLLPRHDEMDSAEADHGRNATNEATLLLYDQTIKSSGGFGFVA